METIPNEAWDSLNRMIHSLYPSWTQETKDVVAQNEPSNLDGFCCAAVMHSAFKGFSLSNGTQLMNDFGIKTETASHYITLELKNKHSDRINLTQRGSVITAFKPVILTGLPLSPHFLWALALMWSWYFQPGCDGALRWDVTFQSRWLTSSNYANKRFQLEK